MSDRTRTLSLRLMAVVGALLLAAPILAGGGLTPTNRDAAKIRQADKLHSDYQSKKLSAEDQAAYGKWLSKATKQQRNALQQSGKTGRTKPGVELATPEGRKPSGPTGLAAAGNVEKSCHCTATCQTVLVVNGGSVYFDGEGEVSGPSACADAAEAFCGSAVSTFLHHWNCK